MKIYNIYFAVSAVIILYFTVTEYNEGVMAVISQFLTLIGVWVLGALSHNALMNHDDEDYSEEDDNEIVEDK